MQKRFRQVYSALKEHSCVSYARIATIGGFCDVDLIVIKATAPDDLPLPDKYVHELLKIFSISSSSIRAFSISFSNRFSKTKSWRVALKSLLLLHRLLRSVPEQSTFRSELLWMRSNGSLSLYPCQFKDDSSNDSENYTNFVRSYAHLLDEALTCFSIDADKEFDEMPETIIDTMKEIGRILELLPQLQSLIDRVMDCRPTGSAARSFVVQSAMKYIIRDSFNCYTTFRSEVILILENLFQMPYRSCIIAFEIYKKSAVQANQLCAFYDWCKVMGFCGWYEYPHIDRIPLIQIQALESFLNGMWQLTESSSSSSSSSSSVVGSMSTYPDDDGDRQGSSKKNEVIVRTEWEKFEDNDVCEEMEPLIRFDDVENVSWETALEAYVNGGNSHDDNGREQGESVVEWTMQVYNANGLNPFFPISSVQNNGGLALSNSAYPGGL